MAAGGGREAGGCGGVLEWGGEAAGGKQTGGREEARNTALRVGLTQTSHRLAPQTPKRRRGCFVHRDIYSRAWSTHPTAITAIILAPVTFAPLPLPPHAPLATLDAALKLPPPVAPPPTRVTPTCSVPPVAAPEAALV